MYPINTSDCQCILRVRHPWLLAFRTSEFPALERPHPLSIGPYNSSTRFLILNQGTLKLTPVSRPVLKSNPFPLFQWIVFHLTLTGKMKPLPAVFSHCLPSDVFMPLCVSSTCVSAFTFTCLPSRESTLPTLLEYLSVCSSHLLSSYLFHELFCLFLASLILLSYLAFPSVNKWLMFLPLAREKLNPLTLCISNHHTHLQCLLLWVRPL